MLRMSVPKNYIAFTILMISSALQANYSIQEKFCSAYKTTIGEIYLKDLSRSVLAGAVEQDNVIETQILGLPVLSVEEANELLMHLLHSLCHTKDLSSAAKDVTVALSAAKVTSYLVAALKNLGIKLPEWVRSHADIHYHLTTLLKGATRSTLRGWLQGLA